MKNKQVKERLLVNLNRLKDVMLFTEVITKAQKNPISEAQMKIEGYEIYKNFEYSDRNLAASGIRGVAI